MSVGAHMGGEREREREMVFKEGSKGWITHCIPAHSTCLSLLIHIHMGVVTQFNYGLCSVN
jgi:hypothetical protein